jgi:hypothetical protein
MNKQELEQWLCGRESGSAALSEIEEIFHVVDAPRPLGEAADVSDAPELRFAIAVLRDVFSRDEDIRAWLVAPASILNAGTPADLLRAGRVRDFVDLAVAEWNRPRANFILRARATLTGLAPSSLGAWPSA